MVDTAARVRARARWRQRNPNHDAQAQRRRRIADPRKMMLAQAKYRAKRDGVVCSITLDDILIPAVCPVLGMPLALGTRVKRDYSPSLDRVDTDKGYVPGNVAVISWRANRLKSDATQAEITAILRYIEAHKSG